MNRLHKTPKNRILRNFLVDRFGLRKGTYNSLLKFIGQVCHFQLFGLNSLISLQNSNDMDEEEGIAVFSLIILDLN